jgi:hypothetical protein
MYRRTAVRVGKYSVQAMAVRADRNLRISGREQFAVTARSVLRKLIGSQRRIVLPHVCRIRMALAAQRRHLCTVDPSAESRSLAHCAFGIVSGRVATVASCTPKPFLGVNVSSETFL